MILCNLKVSKSMVCINFPLAYLGMIVKPRKEEVIMWITEALSQLQIEEGLFLIVILRNLEDLQLRLNAGLLTKKAEHEDEEMGLVEDDYELVYEDDYEFIQIEQLCILSV